MEKACQDAITAAGGPAKLAAALSGTGITITSQAICQWKKVPAERVIAVEKITGISRHELRPDVFGTLDEAAA